MKMTNRRRGKLLGRKLLIETVKFQQSVGMEWAWVRKACRGASDIERLAWAKKHKGNLPWVFGSA